MRKIDKRQGLMLCAAGLLVIVMLTVFIRLGTSKVLVNRAHMDNAITQIILYGNSNLQKIDTRAPQKKIVWEKAYPFADIDGGNKVTFLFTKKIESKAANVEKKIGEWTGKHLLGYYKLAETGRAYESAVGWNLVSPDLEIAPLGDGAWTYVYSKYDVSEESISISKLANNVRANGGHFMYIQAPFKVDPYADFAINGRLDFTNQNCDDLLSKLQNNGIETLDLRENLHSWSQQERVNYHDFFFRTDHHWKPETALRAAKVVGERLKSYGITVDDTYYDLNYFSIDIIPKYFLGSQGKKATLGKTEPDDFSILHPKFPTHLHFSVPELNVDEVGNFEITYDKKEVARRDFYNLNPYGMYGYADRALITIENLLMPETDKKVLLIRDSFCDTMGPFLALGIRNLEMLDVRHFTGSVETYIEEHKPAVVIVMETGAMNSPIDWSTHKDKYDFR